MASSSRRFAILRMPAASLIPFREADVLHPVPNRPPKSRSVLASLAQCFPGGVVSDDSDPECLMLKRQLQ